ncbi:flagellar assembly protein T N-terminal domain-containing protein [Gilvimarinus sp. SDUM040013]|uniref:Flagellar assembly protein T N-terminal domain-containing protein n=1 Tax=Gilvimarinus gilvus TaxID=3058038 RepID=A0ABU4S349_9GAMM|nr:flagellar assembly protein T N-terminal domain-containing protein [Gilvimarinus sp. SDUM040013]MDO3385347.1 flagellar assembly protein T N-terminal domain-containing protein [Gilvimarinus sp. SDUM040013]MDX6850922.1 flagellar assembly protein T N-terminal domain-containing protein [Gilvimarinus sp. SDUM040013]
MGTSLIRSAVLLLVFSLTMTQALAISVVSEGKSAIKGDLADAREKAIADAARQALLHSGATVSSRTQVQQGITVADDINLSAQGHIENLDIISESHNHEVYRVKIRAEVAATDAGSCPGRYSKSLLVTAFNQERPSTTRVGDLSNVDSALPQALAERLYPNHNLQVQTQPELLLSSSNRLMSNHYELFNAVQQVANQYQAQYVITGTVMDMSMVNPNGYYRQNLLSGSTNRVTSTVKGWVGADRDDIRERQFAFRLMMHDGLTGARIFDKTYSAEGLWDAKYTARTGFASPGFWQTDYGQAASTVIDQAVADVSRKVHCQPFMAPLKVSAYDQHVYLLAGANNGVDVGDSFNVFAQGSAPFANIQHYGTMALSPVSYKKLDATEVKLTVTQTYPTYSVGRFDGPLQPHLQYMALANAAH